MLQLSLVVGWPDSSASVAWLGQVSRLEELSLEGVGSDDLVCLPRLTRLKSLTLNIRDCKVNEQELDKRLAMVGRLPQLRRVRLEGFPGARIAPLCNLNNLKSLTLCFDPIADRERIHGFFEALGRMTKLEELQLALGKDLRPLPEDLECLRGLTNLTSLRLDISCAGSEWRAWLAAIADLPQLRRLWLEGDQGIVGIADLAPLVSLEEVMISDHRMATPAALESLSALKRLRAIFIVGLNRDLASATAEGANLRRALVSLRRSHPGIIVGDYRDLYTDKSNWESFDDRTSDLDAFLGFTPFPW
jgi:hypothetical protein